MTSRLVFLCILFFFIPIAQADWTADVTINKIYPHSTYTVSGAVLINTEEAMINPNNCSSSANYALDLGTAASDQIFSLILMAAAMNKKIQIYVDATECVNSYPKISHLRIYP